MNKVILIGRLTDEPDYTEKGETKIARYTLAVDRTKDGADFPHCVTFGKGAEFADKYLHKGTKIAVTGRIQTGSYEKDGRKVYTTDVVVDSHEFCEKKQEEPDRSGGFTNVPDNFVNPFD